MDNRIVYGNSDGGVCVVYPCDCGLTIEEIALKDVPDGVPFWIVDVESIPTDRAFRDAWELDANALGKAHGKGSTAEYLKRLEGVAE